jgi:uncharacterized protein (DUF983 family)
MKMRCPRCLQGALFELGLKMHKTCPACGLLFEREAGYFVGSMYISYALASLFLGVGMLVGHLLAPDWDLGWLVLILGVAFVPRSPDACERETMNRDLGP